MPSHGLKSEVWIVVIVAFAFDILSDLTKHHIVIDISDLFPDSDFREANAPTNSLFDMGRGRPDRRTLPVFRPKPFFVIRIIFKLQCHRVNDQQRSTSGNPAIVDICDVFLMRIFLVELFFRLRDLRIVEDDLFHASAGKAHPRNIKNSLICATARSTALSNSRVSESREARMRFGFPACGYKNIPIVMASFIKEIDMPKQVFAIRLWRSA